MNTQTYFVNKCLWSYVPSSNIAMIDIFVFVILFVFVVDSIKKEIKKFKYVCYISYMQVENDLM